jgi:hypothetical protein
MIDLEKAWATAKQRPADAIGLIIAAGFIAASTTIGLCFAYEEGRSMSLALTGALLCVILSGELFKALYIPLTWRRGRYLSALLGLPIFCLCVFYSWTANKQTMERNFGQHEFATVVESASYKAVKANMDRLEERYKPIEKTRPTGTINAELKGKLAMPGLDDCVGETNDWRKRTYCPEVTKLRAELANAEERDKLGAQLAVARTRLEAIEDPGAKREGFSATALTGLASYGLQFSSMMEMLAFIIAVLIEGGSSLAPTVLVSGKPLALPLQDGARGGEIVTPAEATAFAPMTTDHGDERINQVAAFFGTRCERRHGASLKATTAWQAFLDWCKDAGQEPIVGQNQFWQLASVKLNFARRNITTAEGRGMHYVNMALKKPQERMAAKIIQLYRTSRTPVARPS